jgi:UDP-N-acetylmuramyl pentapeptide phosphotransferase/UDP-N-acetylglucosamine-1-phosphate transferase
MIPVLLGLPFLSLLLCSLVIRLGVKDAPDGGRKTQKAPVPTAGGIAIALSAILGLFLVGDLPVVTENGLPALLLFVFSSVIIGFLDDFVGLNPKLKLLLLALVSLLAAAFGPRLGFFHLPFGPGEGYALPVWLSVTGVGLWLFVMANATNFMDGSNGLATGSAALMLIALSILLYWLAIADPDTGPELAMSHVTALVAAATAGFLVWNLAGRLYVGDTGSLGLGALLGAAGLVVACRLTVWEPVILTLPFLVDVFMTLIWRARAGRHLFEPHRDHAYQLFLRDGWPHWRVAALWAAMTTVSGAGLLALGPFIGAEVIFVLLALGIGLWIWQRVTLGRRLASEGR